MTDSSIRWRILNYAPQLEKISPASRFRMKLRTVKSPALFLTLSVVLYGSFASAAPIPLAAQPFPLGDVQLLDSPFKAAMERNAAYLLSLDPDRLLHNTLLYAGLKPKGELYGGWEAKGIAGHTLGHYLTAISQQYASTGDKRFRDRIDYIVSQMAECQKLYGDGYIGALPPLELSTLRDFKKGIVQPASPFNFKGGAWVPWYTEHKVLAGLKDAWVLGGNQQAKDVTLKLADWIDSVTAGLTPEQLQAMLQVEQGGMSETLTEIYELTGNQKYLDTAKRFYHKAVMDPLLAGRDSLPGLHANTQMPKVIGQAVQYEATGDPDGRKIAENFWDFVVHHHSWVNGGNSDSEHFFPEGKAAAHLNPATAETCNVYNMLKLTKHLFEWTPSVEYADFYERGLYNQILASQEPTHGMFTYFISLKPGHFRTYSTPFDSFWCCVGTGMENHTKYGGAIYYHAGDKLWVNLFIPSVLQWKEKGLLLAQETTYPLGDIVSFTVKAAPASPLTFLIRCPGWAGSPLGFQLNGAPLGVKSQPGQFAEVTRVWKAGDRLLIKIPMGLRTEELEGSPNKVAFLYGPLLLAGDLGPVTPTASFPYAKNQADNFRAPTADVPVLVRPESGSLIDRIKRLPGKELAFQTEGIGKPTDVTLRPFISIPYERYNIYWNVISEQDWKARAASIEAAEAQQRADDARTVDEYRPGEQQSEIDHAATSQNSAIGDFQDRKWRDAHGWFEFQMKVLPGQPQVLSCTYWGGDRGHVFDILVNGKVIATQTLDGSNSGKFFQVEYPIPASVLAGKDKMTVHFQAHPGSVAGGLFNARTLKAVH